jgi:enoyl-CoA hydratase/carnithine racemase
MNYTTIDCRLADRILTITLNRPERLNAFTVTMAEELEHAFRHGSGDDDVGAIIVTGAGCTFCAGMDLATSGNVFGLDESLQPTLADMRGERLEDPAILRGVRDTGGRVVLAIYDCMKPVIGAINGAAVGIGATMTLPMDIRLAAEGAKIGFVFGRLGIVPEACSSWFLPRLVGIPQALEWIYAAEPFEATEGMRAGLIKAVVPQAELLGEARRLARRFIENRSPVAVALARQLVYRNVAASHPIEAHRVDSLAMWHLSQRDGAEGVRAFLEKRAPQFTAKVSRDLPDFVAEWIRQP